MDEKTQLIDDVQNILDHFEQRGWAALLGQVLAILRSVRDRILNLASGRTWMFGDDWHPVDRIRDLGFCVRQAGRGWVVRSV